MASDEDFEIERINKRKLEEIIRRRERNPQAAGLSGKPITLTDATFSNEVSKHRLMVVDFWASWCGPCRMIGPIIEELAGELSGRVTFGKLNVDENPVTSSQFQVQSIPLILIFKEGRPIDGVLGAVPKSTLLGKLSPHMLSQ